MFDDESSEAVLLSWRHLETDQRDVKSIDGTLHVEYILTSNCLADDLASSTRRPARHCATSIRFADVRAARARDHADQA